MQIDRNLLLAIKDKANDHIIQMFDALEIEYKERYQYVYAACPIHDGAKEDGWSWHLEFGVFQCYTRGCHNDNGKDIFALIMGIKKCGFKEAVNFVKNFCNVTEDDLKDITERQKNKKFVRSIEKEVKNQTVYPEECLSKLEYHGYLETRNFPKELIEEYQIGLGKTPYRKMYNRIVFPIRNIDGGIVGFTGRDITGNGPKWIHSYDFDKDKNLFNIDRAIKDIQKHGLTIVVEGPIDVLRLEQAGIHNSVAILGRTITNGQIGLLMKAGVTAILFALDDDQAGKTGMDKAIQIAETFFDVDKLVIGDGKDFGDLTPDEAKEIVNEKIRDRFRWCGV